MILVDSHCHLDIIEKYDSMNHILKRAFDSKVYYIQTICVKLEEFPKVLDITKTYKNIFCSVGIHPSEVKKIINSDELIKLSKNKKVIGLGETGLDYYYNKEVAQQELQKKSFKEHIKASYKTKIPLIVHSREAEEDTFRILNYYKKNYDFSAVIHCFSGSLKFAKRILDLGLYISVSGVITFKNSDELRSIIKFIPIDRLLLETDSPYLTPVPKRGRINEPSYIRYTAEIVASLKEISFSECAKLTTDNFFKLFSKALAK